MGSDHGQPQWQALPQAAVINPAFTMISQASQGEFKKSAGSAVDMVGANMPKPGIYTFLAQPAFDFIAGDAIEEFFNPGWEKRYMKVIGRQRPECPD